jgi:eukaryotic-like serine/threonine-protein kinase
MVAAERLSAGRYETIKPIASGGMATVYLARTLGVGGFQRLVAIKKMHPHIAAEEDFVSMFLDEARLTASIRHPNVVATIDIDQGSDGLFIVMEYIEGASLQRIHADTRKRNEYLPLGFVLRSVIDTLQGLHAAHELTSPEGAPLGIVHRDVSPHNVLVGVDGISRITDFGVARAEERITSTRDGMIKGKLSYMAPEQVKGASVDRRADVYAVGVMLWELLTGKRLFPAEEPIVMMQKVLDGVKVRPSEHAPVPPEIDAVCMKALAPVDGRYASAQDFADALEEAAMRSRSPIGKAREVGQWAKASALDITNLPAARTTSPSFPEHTPPSHPSLASGIAAISHREAVVPYQTGSHANLLAAGASASAVMGGMNPAFQAAAYQTGMHRPPGAMTGASAMMPGMQAVQAYPNVMPAAVAAPPHKAAGGSGKTVAVIAGIAVVIVAIGVAVMVVLASSKPKPSVEPTPTVEKVNGSSPSTERLGDKTAASASAATTAAATTAAATTQVELDPVPPSTASAPTATGQATASTGKTNPVAGSSTHTNTKPGGPLPTAKTSSGKAPSPPASNKPKGGEFKPGGL